MITLDITRLTVQLIPFHSIFLYFEQKIRHGDICFASVPYFCIVGYSLSLCKPSSYPEASATYKFSEYGICWYVFCVYVVEHIYQTQKSRRILVML